MATNDYFADPPIPRDQKSFFSPSLDGLIGDDDRVRLFDEILRDVDWRPWEARHTQRRGRPPIHPRYLCGVILWGLLNGIRSSRKLEEACARRLDFIWLLEGLKIDHTTIAKFRTRCESELMSLFRHTVLTAREMGVLNLGCAGFDGTRVRANNSRYNTLTAAYWDELADAADAEFQKMLEEWKAQDREEQLRFDNEDEDEGSSGSVSQLPSHLADADARRQQLRKAAEKAKRLDELRRSQGEKTNSTQVPVADPDSRVMPNKEGGFAPNYTPTTTSDANGFILDCNVTDSVNESHLIGESLDCIQDILEGELPDVLMSDSGNASGSDIREVESRGVKYLVPMKSSLPAADSPVLRDDLKTPVSDDQWDQLPLVQGQLSKSCFVYCAEEDIYYCPAGKTLHFEKTKSHVDKQGQRIERRVYRCDECDGCKAKPSCIQSSNKRGRTITKDENEDLRETMAARMSRPEVKELYNQRSHIAETPFAHIKSQLNLRQFLLRGLEKVKLEWRWAATALNMRKLMNALAPSRAHLPAAT